MSLVAFWQGLHEQRQVWAHRAYSEFMDSLDARVRACFTDSGTEASVALFGRTQVGKTTLLLNLLGIDDQHLAQVSQVLRGGRSAGQSSTSTAMQYHRATDDHWYLKTTQQRSRISERPLVEALAQLRAHIESGAALPDDPVEIGIPQKYFAKHSLARPQVRILDLPGDNPKNAQEARHVQQIASRYLPAADLILIVGKLDDLSFLNPKAFNLPGISDWRYTPRRFRVVTTFSFSLESEKEWAKRQPELDAARVRSHVIEQIGTHGIELHSGTGLTQLYFPLDFGESWQKTRIHDAETFTRMDGINRQMMGELLADIAASATVHGRLRQAADSHIVAMRVKQQESLKMHDRLAQLEADKHKAQSDVSQAEYQVELQKKRVSKAQVPSFGMPEQVLIRQKCQEGINLPAPITCLEGLSTETGALFQRISRCCSHLLDAAKALEASEVLPFGLRLHNPIEQAPHDLRRRLDECFSGLRRTLAGYNFEEYFPMLSDDFANDKARLRKLMASAKQLSIDYVAEQWRIATEAALRTSKETLNREERELAIFESVLGECEKKYQQTCASFARWQRHIADFERDMDLEVERGERFSRYLREAFDQELVQRRQAMNNEPSAARRLLQLLSCQQLCDERDKLLFG